MCRFLAVTGASQSFAVERDGFAWLELRMFRHPGTGLLVNLLHIHFLHHPTDGPFTGSFSVPRAQSLEVLSALILRPVGNGDKALGTRQRRTQGNGNNRLQLMCLSARFPKVGQTLEDG